MENKNSIKVDISKRTIFTILILIFSLWSITRLKGLIIEIFISLLLMLILNPLVKKISSFKIPRIISILLVYIVIFGFLGVSIASITPPLVKETTKFVQNLPLYIQNLPFGSEITVELENEFMSQIGNISGQIVKFSVSFFTNIITILTTLVFTFYLLLTRDNLKNHISPFVGQKYALEFETLLKELEIKLGGWARGQFILMLTVGVLTYIGLVFLGVDYALPLAILAGIFEALPVIGPVISAIPAALIGFGTSTVMGFSVIVLSVVIQQLENHILVPKIMEKSAGVSPIIILLGVAIGFNFAGISGIIISVPVIIITQVILEKYIHSKSIQ